jgi:multisubunit Na+/H+ antiporter MnhB subunit
MWLSLKCRRQADVAGSTFSRIILLPNICWLFVFIFLGGSAPGGTFSSGLVLWFVLGIVVDVFYALWSRRRLLRGFRRFATLEYVQSGPSGHWGRWLGMRYSRWFRTPPPRQVG